MTALRVAVVGCGHLGAIHARKLANNPHVALTHVVDPSEAHRSKVSDATGAVPLGDLGALTEPIDAAVVCTPTRSHLSVAQQLMVKGVHLFVEKPLAPTTEEAAALCESATQNDCVLQVGHVERFNPAYAAVRPYLASPRYIETRRTSGFTFRSVDIGAVLDLMIHDIDIVLDLTQSEVTSVTAFGCALLGKREDTAQARLHFANGCIADLHASRVSMERTRRMNVVAPEYQAHVDFAELTAHVTQPGPKLVDGQFDAEEFSPCQRQELGPHFYESLFEMQEIAAQPRDAIEAEHTDFLAAILGKKRPLVDEKAGLRAVQVADQILDAIDRHCWDGRDTGRLGPRFVQPPQIVRPLQWPTERPAAIRKAG